MVFQIDAHYSSHQGLRRHIFLLAKYHRATPILRIQVIYIYILCVWHVGHVNWMKCMSLNHFWLLGCIPSSDTCQRTIADVRHIQPPTRCQSFEAKNSVEQTQKLDSIIVDPVMWCRHSGLFFFTLGHLCCADASASSPATSFVLRFDVAPLTLLVTVLTQNHIVKCDIHMQKKIYPENK